MSQETIKRLIDDGAIKVYDIHSVIVMADKEKNLQGYKKGKSLSDVIENMKKNDEVLVEGQIPANYWETKKIPKNN